MNDHRLRMLNDDPLPVWFLRPVSRLRIQASLFPEDVHDVLARLKISPDEVARWRQAGWVSFDADTARQLEPDQVSELVFVRDVARSGLPDAVLRVLFEQLPEPLAADPDRIAFSFTHGWVEPAFVSEPDPEEFMETNTDAWLEQLAVEARWERLEDLGDRIKELLASTRAPDRQGPSE